MNALALHVQHYIAQKLEAERWECQDAIAFSSSKGVFAVADGATEAYGSRYWSRLIAKSWIRFLSSTDQGSLLMLASRLGERAHKRWSKKKLPWYAEEQLSRGSFAAFLGAEFQLGEGHAAWRAISIGDCCLVQTRKGQTITAVPFSDPSEFTYHPILLPSAPGALELVRDEIKVFQGEAIPGDTFLLMSDALACWFLSSKKAGCNLAEEFQSLLADGRTEALDIFIDDRRRAAEMKNDDVCAIYIQVNRS